MGARKKVRASRDEEMVFLKMQPPSRIQLTSPHYSHLRDDLTFGLLSTNPALQNFQVRECRVNLRIENEIQYRRALDEIALEMQEQEGVLFKEAEKEKRWNWAVNLRETTGSYPKDFKAYYVKDGEAPKEKKKGDKKGKKGKKGKKATKKKGGKKGKKGKGKKGKKGKKGDPVAKAAGGGKVHSVAPAEVVADMKESVERFVAW